MPHRVSRAATLCFRPPRQWWVGEGEIIESPQATALKGEPAQQPPKQPSTPAGL